MKKTITLFLLLLLVGCNSTSEKVVVSENVTPTKSTQDNQPEVEPEPIVSLNQLTENEDLLLSDFSCEDENPFHNLKNRYETVTLLYKDKKLDYTATPKPIGSANGMKKYFLEFIPDGQFFELKTKAGLLGEIPENAFNDLLVLETLQLKVIEEKKVIFETSFLSQRCELSFNRQMVLYANDSDRDGVANDVDCAPSNPLATTLHRGYLDRDGDGYGAGSLIELCSGQYGSGISARSGDCDDSDSRVHPGTNEIFFDGRDNDCDGIGL